MKDKRATTAIFLNKWRPNKEGKCPVSIRVTYNGVKRYYPTEFNLSPAEFAKTRGEKPRAEFKEIAIKLHGYEQQAAEIIDEIPVFTFDFFEKKYYSNTGASNTLKDFFEHRIAQYKETGRIGTAVTYECAMKSLARFVPNAKFIDVTPQFLEEYEAWMIGQGRSKTTIGIYLRSLRSLFNDAIADKLLTKDHYPFGKRKYQIPTGRNIKKALTLAEIGKIYTYPAEPGSAEEMAKDYWLFLYFCNGMNVKDVALLQYKNLQKDILVFERAKTARTRRDAEPIRVVVNEDSKAIINRQGNKPKSPDTYIFPILRKGLSPVEVRNLVQLKIKVINDHMKVIGTKLGIDQELTTYVARHSYATVMQRSGASIDYIREALGQSSTQTTMNYLAGFEDDYSREMNKALTAFK
jgi:integrase